MSTQGLDRVKDDSRVESRIVLAFDSIMPFLFDGQRLGLDLSESLDDGQNLRFDFRQNLLLFRNSLDTFAVRVVDKQDFRRVFMLRGEVNQYVLGAVVAFDSEWIS